MAENTIRNNYSDLAEAIRTKKGTSNLMTPAEMVSEIADIVKPTGTLSITENGEGIDVTAYAAVDVNVQGGGGIEAPEYTGFYFWDEHYPDQLYTCDYVSSITRGSEGTYWIHVSSWWEENPQEPYFEATQLSSDCYFKTGGSGTPPQELSFEDNAYYKYSSGDLSEASFSSETIYVFDYDNYLEVEQSLPSTVGDSVTFTLDGRTYTVTLTSEE